MLPAHRAQRSTEVMGVITSILALRKVKRREITWQQYVPDWWQVRVEHVSLGSTLPPPDFMGL